MAAGRPEAPDHEHGAADLAGLLTVLGVLRVTAPATTSLAPEASGLSAAPRAAGGGECSARYPV